MRHKRVGTSKYKGVFEIRVKGKQMWLMDVMINGYRTESKCETEIGAAKLYDMARIRAGKEPVNIMKRT